MLSQTKKRVVEAITNTFEHGTPQAAYESCERLKDGRGFTCGRAGFTTATGDAYWVVDRYVRARPVVPLALYLPELRRLASLPACDAAGRGFTGNLSGFGRAWALAANNDPQFRAIQDELNQQLYMIPALKLAKQYEITTPLGRAIFYDTLVQHGYTSSADGNESGIDTQRILDLTGGRRFGESETMWLNRFLHVRGQMLCCYPDNVWPASADRVHDLRQLLLEGQTNLSGNVLLASTGVRIMSAPTAPSSVASWVLPA
ncbi:lysozyme-like domain-containing protein [Thamnocephalis sphaerospora]|uniref:Lysozyme-like domain-containing protein n=1 Tax=Thamnocephalis sphaerospora TaxID=78915 RepID=A0A4P9XI62_9FUNG|nr:lysozyme-like domain-containing protein [Thamnocephalis sphaerospora]|eukprot:RKP05366.1 lysozyme-like domain-containing protein [Thamnocephalis sphaerospora]